MHGRHGHECGLLTSGGTESVLLAVLAHRQRDPKRRPEVVAANTAHPAVHKACHYFGLKLVTVPVGPSTGFALTPAAARRALSADTVLLYASAPTFPHGVVDDIAGLGALAEEWGVGLHVDNCLGGVLLSFAEGVAPFDFRVRGVTSMSVDLHKYGGASKGASAVLFKNTALRQATYVPLMHGCEGLYITPTIQGARGGAVIAQAWATVLFHGQDGYREMAQRVAEAQARFAAVVDKTEGVKVLVTGTHSILPITNTSPSVCIYKVASMLETRGWNLFTGQHPSTLCVCLSEKHLELADAFETDFAWAVAEVAAGRGKTSGAAAVYGAMKSAPEAVIRQILLRYQDMQMTVKPK